MRGFDPFPLTVPDTSKVLLPQVLERVMHVRGIQLQGPSGGSLSLALPPGALLTPQEPKNTAQAPGPPTHQSQILIMCSRKRLFTMCATGS